MTVDDARRRLRGKAGTSVTLLILHEGETQPIEKTLARRIIQVDTVWGDTRNPDGTWNYFLPGPDKAGRGGSPMSASPPSPTPRRATSRAARPRARWPT